VATPFEAAVLREINTVRAEHGLSALRPNSELMTVAAVHSSDMIQSGYFAHESRDGLPFWQRVIRYYPGRSVGENLAWYSPSLTPAGTVKLWLQSPGHRATMLDPRWREAGVGVASAGAAPGVFRGTAATVVTVDFGSRR
jgi:uncharacterized protein YkwD